MGSGEEAGTKMKIRTNKIPPREVLDVITNYLEYRDGDLYWKAKRFHKSAGDLAGGLGTSGYWVIGIFRKLYYAHHVVWFLHHGEWPQIGIDHKDRNERNNRIENLRLATTSENARNKKQRIGSSGIRGVWRAETSKRNPYQVCIKVDGKWKHIGLFPTKESAAKARIEAEQKYFGEFALQA